VHLRAKTRGGLAKSKVDPILCPYCIESSVRQCSSAVACTTTTRGHQRWGTARRHNTDLPAITSALVAVVDAGEVRAPAEAAETTPHIVLRCPHFMQWPAHVVLDPVWGSVAAAVGCPSMTAVAAVPAAMAAMGAAVYTAMGAVWWSADWAEL